MKNESIEKEKESDGIVSFQKETIDPSKWKEMDADTLIGQRNILTNRLAYAMQLGNSLIVKQLQNGIDKLDKYLEEKSPKSPNYF